MDIFIATIIVLIIINLVISIFDCPVRAFAIGIIVYLTLTILKKSKSPGGGFLNSSLIVGLGINKFIENEEKPNNSKIKKLIRSIISDNIKLADSKSITNETILIKNKQSIEDIKNILNNNEFTEDDKLEYSKKINYLETIENLRNTINEEFSNIKDIDIYNKNLNQEKIKDLIEKEHKNYSNKHNEIIKKRLDIINKMPIINIVYKSTHSIQNTLEKVGTGYNLSQLKISNKEIKNNTIQEMVLDPEDPNKFLDYIRSFDNEVNTEDNILNKQIAVFSESNKIVDSDILLIEEYIRAIMYNLDNIISVIIKRNLEILKNNKKKIKAEIDIETLPIPPRF